MGLESRQADDVARGARIPSGTVTFLFTDIEGSTKRWERFGQQMGDAVRRHDAALARVFREHGGYVFKTVGDAFCVAFSNVHDAVRAAIAAQRAIAADDWSLVNGLAVRMAIHLGSADERAGDYFGPVVNRVARLLGTAHGGQIVLSAAARALAQTGLPADASLIDLGNHRLKDLSEPEAVAQLCASGLRAGFPPLTSLNAAQTNLPLQIAPLIGRQHEIEELAGLVRAKPLVTLCGAGGVGKTRVACQVGADLLAEFPDGVWFIDLAPITDPALAPRVLAATFAVVESGANDIVDQIVSALADRRLLLIFDNCEQIVAAAAALVDAILRGCRDVRVLITTREALRLQGEVLYRVPSLAVPDTSAGLSAEAALRFAAVELFVARISSISTFTLTDENAPIVADICRRLDGIALAIELAASRVKVLSPRQVAQRLDERFRMLTGGSRTALPRQQTLRALIDWSHDLLDERERIVFRRTGVFAASFDLDAAIAICADDVIDEWDIVDLLAALVDKSLVAVEPAGEERRYRLLESMREYARERSVAAGEEAVTRRRWFAYYAALARARVADHQAKVDDSGLAALETENDHFRSLLEWSITAANDPAAGLEFAGTLGDYWVLNGLQPEGFLWLEAGLRVVDEAAARATVARAWLALATLGRNLLLGKRGLHAAQRAVELGRQCDLPSVVARGLLYAGIALERLGKFDDADAAFADALERLRACGEQRDFLKCLISQAGIATLRGREEAARQLYEQALGMLRASSRSNVATAVTANLALLEFSCGNGIRALELGRQAVERARDLNDRSLRVFLLVNLAAFLIDRAEFDEGREAAREALEIASQHGYAIPLCIAIEHLALICAIRGGLQSPARLIGFTQESMQAVGFARQVTEQRGYERLTAMLTEGLGERAFAELREHGRTLTESQAVDLARQL
jgi:predicted ATPase/class 3 adenylate cyclase